MNKIRFFLAFMLVSWTPVLGVAQTLGRNLFVLDDGVASTTLTKSYHVPDYYNGNPILKADKEWELNHTGDPYAAPFSGGVWYDEKVQKFKMWYSAGGKKRLGLITCYAESEDGKNWIKPSLDVVAGTNIVDTIEHDCVSVLLDKFEKDITKRYKMFVVGFNLNNSVSMVLKYSSDGIHWSKPVALSGELYDRCSAYYDPFRQEYVLSLKTLNGTYRRSRNYLSHKDPEMLVSLAHRTFDKSSDKFIRYWFNAEDDDPRNPQHLDIRPQIYNHEATPYEGLTLGYFSVWQGPENAECVKLQVQKRNEVLIGWSSDGFQWNRENKTPFIPVDEDVKAWNAGNIQSTCGNPLIVGDSLYFYVSGRYNSRPSHASNFATGLSILRRDGFVSMQAGKKEGMLLTKKCSIDGDYLFVNADVRGGKLAVEVLDEQGMSIEGFGAKDCIQMRKENSTKHMITWRSQKGLSSLKGKNIHLKFFLTNGNLYSYWISPWESGESRGYTAGGGPNLNATGVDVQ